MKNIKTLLLFLLLIVLVSCDFKIVNENHNGSGNVTPNHYSFINKIEPNTKANDYVLGIGKYNPFELDYFLNELENGNLINENVYYIKGTIKEIITESTNLCGWSSFVLMKNDKELTINDCVVKPNILKENMDITLGLKVIIENNVYKYLNAYIYETDLENLTDLENSFDKPINSSVARQIALKNKINSEDIYYVSLYISNYIKEDNAIRGYDVACPELHYILPLSYINYLDVRKSLVVRGRLYKINNTPVFEACEMADDISFENILINEGYNIDNLISTNIYYLGTDSLFSGLGKCEKTINYQLNNEDLENFKNSIKDIKFEQKNDNSFRNTALNLNRDVNNLEIYNNPYIVLTFSDSRNVILFMNNEGRLYLFNNELYYRDINIIDNIFSYNLMISDGIEEFGNIYNMQIDSSYYSINCNPKLIDDWFTKLHFDSIDDFSYNEVQLSEINDDVLLNKILKGSFIMYKLSSSIYYDQVKANIFRSELYQELLNRPNLINKINQMYDEMMNKYDDKTLNTYASKLNDDVALYLIYACLNNVILDDYTSFIHSYEF